LLLEELTSQFYSFQSLEEFTFSISARRITSLTFLEELLANFSNLKYLDVIIKSAKPVKLFIEEELIKILFCL